MYASVTTGQVQPGRMDEFLAAWAETVQPMVEEFPGIVNLYVLTNKETHKSIIIALYESKADAERTQTSGNYLEAVGKLGSWLVLDSIVRGGYEVSIQV